MEKDVEKIDFLQIFCLPRQLPVLNCWEELGKVLDSCDRDRGLVDLDLSVIDHVAGTAAEAS